MRRRRDRGSTLVLFAVSLMGLLALAALTVDVGLARVTQNEMQTATDAAVLGGFRSLDDVASHTSAIAYGQLAFSDPTGQVTEGEGPTVTFDTPGLELHASQHYKDPGISTTAVYLQDNPGNLSEGDVVSGSYADDPAVALNELETTSATPPHYPRADFSPKGEPNSAIPPGSPPALLVRLRRVNSVNAAPGAVDNNPPVSSSGTALPFLFGHGAFISPEDVATKKPGPETAGSYSPLRDGIAVRATSLAALKPATAVGWTSTADVSTGATVFAIQFAQWNTIVATWNGNGHTPVATPLGPSPQTGDTGCYFALEAGDLPQVPMLGGRIAAAAQPLPNDGGGFVPLYDVFPAPGGPYVVIVGFAAVSFNTATGTTVNVAPALDQNGNAIVVDENATASAYDGFAWTSTSGAFATSAGPLVTLVTADLAALAPSFPLQAPALVR